MLAILCTMTYPGTTWQAKLSQQEKSPNSEWPYRCKYYTFSLTMHGFINDDQPRSRTNIANRERSMFYSQPLSFSIPRMPAPCWPNRKHVKQNKRRPTGTNELLSSSWVSVINEEHHCSLRQHSSLAL